MSDLGHGPTIYAYTGDPIVETQRVNNPGNDPEGYPDAEHVIDIVAHEVNEAMSPPGDPSPNLTGALVVVKGGDMSNTNGAFLIDVGVSNYWYTNGGGSNRPYWLVAGSQGQQLYFCECAANSWGIVDP